jgi:hypothetical protein
MAILDSPTTKVVTQGLVSNIDGRLFRGYLDGRAMDTAGIGRLAGEYDSIDALFTATEDVKI